MSKQEAFRQIEDTLRMTIGMAKITLDEMPKAFRYFSASQKEELKAAVKSEQALIAELERSLVNLQMFKPENKG